MDRSGSISAKTPSAKLKPGQQHTFCVRFNGMEPCPLRFELTDWNSGSITPQGGYTAPDREGSFEIRILCADNPEINTYAYADVRN